MEIYENITSVPSADTQTLELRYQLANTNDTFNVQVWNGSTWENRGSTLNSTSWTDWSYTLSGSEVISGTVQVRFVDVNASSNPQNSILKDYLRVKSETFATAPTVVTNAATNIGTTTATLNGDVTSDGGSAITERGFYCDTDSNPTTKYTVSGTTGAYTKDMTDLSPGTKYYFKAFATNSVGTSYGSILDFTTQVQYKLTMATNAGTTIPSAGDHWYDSGTVVNISASASPGPEGGYIWNGWTGTGTGSYTGMNNPAQVTMNDNITETASWLAAPVHNVTKDNWYTTIQAAVNDADPGNTIFVYAGTFDEQVVINKSLTLVGSGDSTVVQPSSASELTTIYTYPDNLPYMHGRKVASIILVENGGGTSVTIENLKVDGSSVTSLPAGATILAGILYGESGGKIQNVTVNSIKTTDYADRTYGIDLAATGGHVSVEVSNNRVNDWARNGINANGASLTVNIHGNTLTGPSIPVGPTQVPNGIVLWADLVGTVSGNTISSCHFIDPDTSYRSVGIMGFDVLGPSGVLIENNEVYDVDEGVNPSANCIIRNNNLHGDLSGVTLEMDADNNQIINNNIWSNTVGIQINGELNPNPQGVDPPTANNFAHFNVISGNTSGVVNYDDTQKFDARFNWWGDASGPSGSGPGSGDNITDNVRYSPWLGFTVGTVPMTFHVDNTGKIQSAIDAASSGDTILVHDGTYRENLYINKSITLKSASKPIIEAPDNIALRSYTGPSGTQYCRSIIEVYNTTGVTIDGFIIDGRGVGNANPYFMGIHFFEASGIISNNEVKSVRNTPLSGAQNANAIVVNHLWDQYYDQSVIIENNVIYDYQKNGITCNESGTAVIIENNIVIGAGPVSVIAQNGIQIGYGATGTVRNNKVSGNSYTGSGWAATGILIMDNTVDVLANQVDNNYFGIYYSNASGDISGNTVNASAAGTGRTDFVGILIYPNNSGANTYTNSVTNNIVTGDDSGDSAGIYVYNWSSHTINFTATRNTVTDWGEGFVLYTEEGATLNATAHFNTITGNVYYGMDSNNPWGVSTAVNATCNWWGDASGPYNPTTNPFGLGDSVSDNVTYVGWARAPIGTVWIDISPSSQSGANGVTLYYTVTVQNTDDVSHTFDLTDNAGPSWLPSLVENSLTIQPNEENTATLSVTVPSNAIGGTIYNMTVTATCRENTSVSASASCTAVVTIARSVSVSIENTLLEGYPSQVLAYTIDVHNSGNVVDNIILNYIPDGWPDISIVPPVLIDVMPSEHRQATLFVHVPDGALPSTYKEITVVAESQFCGAKDNDSALAHVVEQSVCGVDVTIVEDLLEGYPSQVLAYTIDVHNSGNVTDTIGLSYIPDGWPDIYILDTQFIGVMPSEHRQTTMLVHVPDGALPSTYKEITVVAESQFCGATDYDNAFAHVVATPPPYSGTATFRLENLYKVSVNKNLQLNTGSKLVVKFYDYSMAFESEVVIDTFTPPHSVVQIENVPHPAGGSLPVRTAVKNAELVLTTDDTNNVISTIASWTTHRSDLRTRYGNILRAWGDHSELQSAFRTEIGDILRQWGDAPP
jgi:hypothetical protein